MKLKNRKESLSVSQQLYRNRDRALLDFRDEVNGAFFIGSVDEEAALFDGQMRITRRQSRFSWTDHRTFTVFIL